jgi:hypothetical protein
MGRAYTLVFAVPPDSAILEGVLKSSPHFCGVEGSCFNFYVDGIEDEDHCLGEISWLAPSELHLYSYTMSDSSWAFFADLEQRLLALGLLFDRVY